MVIDELLAVAITARSLSWCDHQTRPIEYVAALSGASSLGSDILRAKHLDKTALRRATLMLARKAQLAGKRQRLHLSPQQAETFAIAALIELLSPQCQACCGTSTAVANNLKVMCPTCNGSGVHRHTDTERARSCGIEEDQWHRWVRRYEMVLELARANDNAVSKASVRLG